MNVLVSHAEMTLRAPAFGGRQSKALLRFVLAAGLLAADCIALIAAFLAAGFVRFGAPGADSSHYLLGALLPIYLVSAGMTGSYSGPVLLKRSHALARGLSALVIAASVVTMVMFFLKAGAAISRFQFGAGLGAAAITLPLVRCLFVRFASAKLGDTLYSIVELRDGVRPAALTPTGARVPSFDTSTFFDPHDPRPDSLDCLAQLVANVDRVIVICPEHKRSAWAHVLQGMNVHGEIVIPSVSDVPVLGVDSYAGKTTLLVGRGPLTLAERFSKRLMDLAFSVSGLLMLWPLMLAVAVLIRLGSPGPVIFKQPRIGRQNRLFYIWKFRSMYLAGCDRGGDRSTLRDDARITPIGRFIRRTSIDELPQLCNVLLGHMSIVGPRPHAAGSKAENLLFWEIDNRYWHRHACKPGLTGLAQVRGFRGSTSCVKDITDRLASDLEYLSRWSLWRDCVIILQTARVLLHRNAY